MSETDKKTETKIELSAKQEPHKERIEQIDGLVVVHLKHPIERKGDKPITSITLNEPTYSQLEQFSLDDLGKVAVLPILIPRIAEEELFEADFKKMKLSDLVPLSMAITAFI